MVYKVWQPVALEGFEALLSSLERDKVDHSILAALPQKHQEGVRALEKTTVLFKHLKIVDWGQILVNS